MFSTMSKDHPDRWKGVEQACIISLPHRQHNLESYTGPFLGVSSEVSRSTSVPGKRSQWAASPCSPAEAEWREGMAGIAFG
jgi:hypothetical protein